MAAVAVAVIDTRKIAGPPAPVWFTAQTAFLDSFQYFPGISLDLFENAAFPFASRRALEYR